MQDFRQLRVWERAHELVLEVHRATTQFPPREHYGFTEQLRRLVASVPTNIVEGSARGSDRETLCFLRIALGSAAEVSISSSRSTSLATWQASTMSGWKTTQSK